MQPGSPSGAKRFPAVASAVLAALALTLGTAAPARAGGLAPEERARLEAGGAVKRSVDVDIGGRPYFGGLSYAVVSAPASAVMEALLDPSAYTSLFALTFDSREVGRQDGDRWISLRHATRVGTVQYTVRARREGPGLVRFWLDPAFEHDVGDLWGFFRVEPLGPDKSLVAYGALLHVESALVRTLFREKVRGYALETPLLLRRYVERERFALRGAQRAGPSCPGGPGGRSPC